jgi:DNA modification methylase
MPRRRKPAPAAEAPAAPPAERPRWLDFMPLDELRKASRNAKKHADALAASLAEHGYGTPVMLDERTGELVAGSGRLDKLVAARAAGAAPPEGVIVDGERWLVPVYRGWRSKDDAQALKYGLADNRVSSAGGFEEDELAALVAQLHGDGVDLKSAAFSDEDVADLVARSLGEDTPKKRDWTRKGKSAPPTENELVTVEAGQLYQIGRHRLLVGDALVDQNVDRLFAGEQAQMVATDPPYSIFGSSTGVSSDVADDSMVRPFFVALFRQCCRVVPYFGHLYLCCDWRSWATIWEASKTSDTTAKNMLVWDKGAGLGSAYMNAHELVFFGARMYEQRSAWLERTSGHRSVLKPNILRTAPLEELVPAEQLAKLSRDVRDIVARLAQVAPPDVLELVLSLALDPRGSLDSVLKVSRASLKGREHNAAKPVPLFEGMIENSSDPDGLVFEPCLGSGTTIIAAESVGRRCYSLELKPKTAQRALRRIQRETGLKAELVL